MTNKLRLSACTIGRVWHLTDQTGNPTLCRLYPQAWTNVAPIPDDAVRCVKCTGIGSDLVARGEAVWDHLEF